MEDVYGDLENYNDVNLVNELKNQNAELKYKLGECVSSMNTLQKDFDKLSAEFKVLETNYSSLLKIARAEIKRKTDMITNLNIEKDMLMINHCKTLGDKRRRSNFYNANTAGRGRTNNNNRVEGPKHTNKFDRRECEPPPSETSSTATDRSHKLSITENRDIDNVKSSDKNVSKKHEITKSEVFPDNRDDYRNERLHAGGIDRRLVMLASHQVSKFSSDEEFEDMYSALEPKTTSMGAFRDEPERGRKRTRDESQPSQGYYDTLDPQQKHPNYAESSRDRYNKSRSRFHAKDRNGNRDKYDLSQPYRNKFSPDRYRRRRREYDEDRYQQPYDRHRRLESPPGERYQHISRERRAYPDNDREDQKLDHRYNNSAPRSAKYNIRGENNEPQNKRPRIEKYPPDESRRLNDEQFSIEHHPIDIRNETSCQSPDYMHTEPVPSNEPIREIKSTAVISLDDPRKSSKKYVKCTDGNKDILYTISSNKTLLQPVNKSLWELKKDELPEALTCKPTQYSEELASEIYMDIDTPLSNLTMVDDIDDIYVTDCRDVIKDTFTKDTVHKNDLKEPLIENVKNKSVLKHTDEKKQNEGEKVQKSIKCKTIKGKVNEVDKPDNADEPSAIVSKNLKKVDTNKPVIKNEESNLLHQPSSATSCSKNSELSLDMSESSDNKGFREHKTVTSYCKEESKSSVSNHREFDHKVYSVRHIVEGDLELSDETNDDTHVQSNIVEKRCVEKKRKSKKKSHRGTSREKHSDSERKSKKTRSKKDKVKESKPKNKFCELFGDSTSLITPEDLELATMQAQAHAKSADSCVPVCEDALDGIDITENQTEISKQKAQDEIPKSDKVLNTDCPVLKSAILEKINVTKATKDGKVGSHNNKQRIEHAIATNNEVKEAKALPSNAISKQTVLSIEKPILPEVTTVLSCDMSAILEKNNITKATKDSKVGSHHNKKRIEHAIAANNEVKEAKALPSNAISKQTVLSIEKPILPEVTTVSSCDKSAILEKNNITKATKDSKVGSHNNKKRIEHAIAANNEVKETKALPSNAISKQTVLSIEKPMLSEVKTVLSCDRSEEMVNVMKPAKKPKNDLKSKELAISSKKSNSNEKNVLLGTEAPKEMCISKNHSTRDSKKPISASGNKENATFKDISKEVINSDIPKMFDDNLVPNKNSNSSLIDSNKANEENNIIKSAKPKETVFDMRVEEIPNLVSVTEDPGLVQTVVMSTGTDSTLLKFDTLGSHYEPIKALATSTPARELSTPSKFSELSGNQVTSCVNGKTENAKPPSENETDVPDVRINCYRRRKKVLKK